MPIKDISDKRVVDATKLLRLGLDGQPVVDPTVLADKPDFYMSHSQLNMLLRCPKQYEFRYVRGMRRPPSGAMVMGSAFHDGQEAGFRLRKEIGRPMRTADILDVYSDSFDERAADEVDWGDEDTGNLKDEGYAITESYGSHFAPKISPNLIEHKGYFILGNITMMVVIDVVDRSHTAIDLKTTGRTWFDADQEIQHYPYLWYLSKLTDGERPWDMDFEYHVCFRGPARKKVKGAAVQPTDITKVHRASPGKFAFGVYYQQLHAARKQIEAGVFPPRTAASGNYLCSEKYCGYWDLCVGRGRTVVQV